MNPDDILKLLKPLAPHPKPEVTAIEGGVLLTYPAASHGARVSADLDAIGAKVRIVASEQTDLHGRDAKGERTLSLRVALRLAPLPPTK